MSLPLLSEWWDDGYSNGIYSFEGNEEDRMMIGNENGLVAFVTDYMNG